MIIFIFSKSSWNVYNFRKNLIKKLISDKHDIFVIAKKDKAKLFSKYLEIIVF